MLAYIIRRIAATIPVMLVVALVVFSLLYLGSGDPATVIAGNMATEEDIRQIREQLGLDRPFYIRFGEWLWAVLHGDLGVSIFTNLPVTELIAQRLEPTLSLTVCTIVLSIVVAIPMGILAAWRAGRALDRAVMGFAVLGFSVPVFVFAYVLILVFSVWLKVLPVQGYVGIEENVSGFLSHMVLPSITLGTILIALFARITRASMLDVLSQDYIRTARAKGVGERGVLVRHALKNASVPIVTMIGIGIALLIGGVVITETVFAIPGLGRLTVDAVLRRDYPVIQGLILMFSAVYVMINLLIDLSYCILDPRIRY